MEESRQDIFNWTVSIILVFICGFVVYGETLRIKDHKIWERLSTQYILDREHYALVNASDDSLSTELVKTIEQGKRLQLEIAKEIDSLRYELHKRNSHDNDRRK